MFCFSLFLSIFLEKEKITEICLNFQTTPQLKNLHFTITFVHEQNSPSSSKVGSMSLQLFFFFACLSSTGQRCTGHAIEAIVGIDVGTPKNRHAWWQLHHTAHLQTKTREGTRVLEWTCTLLHAQRTDAHQPRIMMICKHVSNTPDWFFSA